MEKKEEGKLGKKLADMLDFENMKKEEAALMKALVDLTLPKLKSSKTRKLLKIIDFLIEHRNTELSKVEVVKGAEVPKNFVYSYWDTIVESGFVKETRKLGNTQLYLLNKEDKRVIAILSLYDLTKDSPKEKKK